MIHRVSRSGLFLALLALVIQFASGMAGGFLSGAYRPAPSAPEIALLSALLPGAGILCHGDTDAPSQVPGSPGQQHQHGDCAICPLCVVIAQPLATPAASPSLPPPSMLAVRLAAPPPQATAPPFAVHANAQPRAPPALA